MAWVARRRSMALIGVIGILLPILAVLQYRWLGELSGLEQLRARTNLTSAAARFSAEFDAQLAGLYAVFNDTSGVDPAARLEAVQQVVRSLPAPQLVERVYVIDHDTVGGFTRRVVDASGAVVGAADWPTWLTPLATASPRAGLDASPASGLTQTLIDDVPALVVHHRSADRDRWTVIVLNLATIGEQLLPARLAGCFEGGIPVNYDLLIIRDAVPDAVVYRSRPDLTRAHFDANATTVPVFAIHGRDLDLAAARSLLPDAAAHRWRVLVQPQAGALEAAIGAARFRNVGIGIGILALLAISVGLLIASTSATARTTREQLDLVARISHELRTPLATITCAGENLADKLVANPIETQQYGDLIKREGRRLTRTLEDILLCCRLQARPRPVLNRQPIDLAKLIEQAVRESTIGDSGRVETSVAVALPPVLADADALHMAFKNLLGNAIKYGDGRPVRVWARSLRSARGSEVIVGFEDEGHGIPADEVEHVFDPFFRGRMARSLEVQGSGIGLAIVKEVVRAHGGIVRVSRNEPRGTRFVVQLPAIRARHPLPADSAA
jgi:signal transduction histidine kinase